MKNSLKELILPSFWLLIFIVSSKNENRIKIKKENNAEQKLNDVIQGSGSSINITKNKISLFTKDVSLPGF